MSDEKPSTELIPARRGLTKQQVARLLKPIDSSAVDVKQGQSYIAQHEVRAELSRVFGFGNWDAQTEKMEFLWEKEVLHGDPEYPNKPKQGNPPYYRACYMASVRIRVRDYWGNILVEFVGYHAEANSVLPDRGEAHAMAITSAESYAFRRACINLGDRFGLSLYDKGSTHAYVKGTLQITDPESPLYISEEERKQAQEARAARMQAALNSGEAGAS